MADASPKKEKKDKMDKKDKKDKKEKKEKKRQQITSLGESVEPGSFKSSDDYLDNERFKPVPNPAFNPALISPLNSPGSSIKSGNSAANNDEKWTISSKRTGESLPIVQTNQQLTPAGENTSPLTPAELQGFAAQKYVPSPGYAHLDPTKHENAHSAFDHLQKVIMAGKDGVLLPQPQQPQQRPAQQPQHAQQQQRLSPQQQRLSPQQRPSQPVAGNFKGRPEHLADGRPVLQYVRALWNYTAQIPSELSFNVNDSLAVLSRQPDGWWYAELLDKKKRGLVPGNYMTSN